jgi:predicted metalloprotease with PDZ domain
MIELEQYLGTISNKIAESLTLYRDELAFTRMSRKCLEKYSDEYGNVYQKGALIGLCLDVELRRLSRGGYGLIDLMKDLGDRFGANRPFKDKALFREIEALTYPEIGDFLRTYVSGNEPLPLQRIFAQIGVFYQVPKPTMEFTLGRVSLAYNPETQRIFVHNTYELNEFGRAIGYKTGDEIHSFQGMEVDLTDPNSYIEKVIASMKEGASFEVKVYRKNEAGEFELKTLRADAFKVEQMGPPLLEPVAVPTRSQQELLNDWMKK